MPRNIEFAPQYFSEIWKFLRDPRYNIDNLTDPSKELSYSPWTAFVTGTAIFASILAIDAARSVRFFDRVVLVTVLLVSAIGFALIFHATAKLLKGHASTVHVVCGVEYLLGFLVPSLFSVVYSVVLLISLSPGLQCNLGPFRLYCENLVPTTLNRILLSSAYLVLISGAAYSLYRAFVFFRELERLTAWKTLTAMGVAGAIIYSIQGQLGFYARLFSGQLDKVLKILSGS
jgi:hypothetical protein